MFDENRKNNEEFKKEKAAVLEKQTLRVIEYDNNLAGLEKRARFSEIILGIVIVLIINCACFVYCKMYNKK